MRLIPRLIGCLMIVCGGWWLPGPGQADENTVLVFLDNSGSMSELSKTYQRDILALMKVFSGKRLYFAPIGAPSGPVRLVDSADEPAAQRQSVQSLFRFQDAYTKVDLSLQRVEATTAFAQAHQILIVSDMESDFDNAGIGTLNGRDLKDLRSALQRLESWVTQHDKSIELILHGWNAPPNHPKRAWQRFAAAWQSAQSKARTGLLKQVGENRRLIGLGVQQLDETHANRMVLRHIAKAIDRRLNQEGFRNVLCGILPIADPQEQVCLAPAKDTFNVRIDVDHRIPQLSRAHLQALEELIPPDVIPQSGPKRAIRVEPIRRGVETAHDSNADYHFRVLRSRRGAPHHYPTIQATAHTCQAPDVKEKDAVRSQSKRTSPRAMLSWSGKMVKTLLEQYIDEDCPIPERKKKFWLFAAPNQPLQGGYDFFVRTAYEGGQAKQTEIEKLERSNTLIPLSTTHR